MGGVEGGTSFNLTRGEELVAYESAKSNACSALQAEARALRRGLMYVLKMGISSCSFRSDSQTLANTTMQYQPPLGIKWRAFRICFIVGKS